MSHLLPDGVARRSDGALWEPRPHPDSTNFSRRAYLAGYSDGFHEYPFGAGDDGSFGAFSDYRVGFDHGRRDSREPSRAIPADHGFSQEDIWHAARHYGCSDAQALRGLIEEEKRFSDDAA